MYYFIAMVIVFLLFALYLLVGYWGFWTALLINLPFILFFGLRTFARLRDSAPKDRIRYLIAAIWAAIAAIVLVQSLSTLKIWGVTIFIVSAYLFYEFIVLLEYLYVKYKKAKD